MSLSVHIRKDFGDFTLNVNLENEGGILGLLDPSGCGKSMTLTCIAGVERPDEGRIVLNGVTLFDSEKGINLPPQQRNVGFLFQNYALFPTMTVKQNILCGLCREKDKAKRQAECEKAVRLLGLEGLEHRRPSQLSGGQQQRAALARILVGAPELLLLDEPFSALDSHLRLRLQMEMRELLSAFGKDVLLVTHSRDEAYHLSQNIAVMTEGSVRIMKETRALFADPESVDAARITGCKNIYAAQRLDEHIVGVPALGVCFHTARPVREGLTAVGIRAHAFSPDTGENQFSVTFDSEMEEPFERIIRFRYARQMRGSEPVWWRVSKSVPFHGLPEKLGVSGEDILLLYE